MRLKLFNTIFIHFKITFVQIVFTQSTYAQGIVAQTQYARHERSVEHVARIACDIKHLSSCLPGSVVQLFLYQEQIYIIIQLFFHSTLVSLYAHKKYCNLFIWNCNDMKIRKNTYDQKISFHYACTILLRNTPPQKHKTTYT